jgi:hypothetical protein
MTIFTSAANTPVVVNPEINLETLYFSDYGPVTFRDLRIKVRALYHALEGAEMILKGVPDDLEGIEPQKCLLQLALDHIGQSLDAIYPHRTKSGLEVFLRPYHGPAFL